MKKTIVVIFFIIIFSPIMCWIISSTTGLAMDVSLQGYTDKIEEPTFSISNIQNGYFQDQFCKWFENNLKPKGILIKTHSQLQYSLFNLGKHVIGNNKDVFEKGYIFSELCIEGYPNYTSELKKKEMHDYVNKIVKLHDMLQERGKYMLICISPNKADYHYDNIPQKYKDIAPSIRIKPIDCFEQLIRETNVPCFISRNIRQESLLYPAFYTTGTHWSRTFEQQVLQIILQKVKNEYKTDKHIPQVLLGDICCKTSYFWRDEDLYDLLNLWEGVKDKTYYEYNFTTDDIESTNEINILIHGTSFSSGFWKDLLTIIEPDHILYINRNNYYRMGGGDSKPINSWEMFEKQILLDKQDLFIFETTEVELTRYGYGLFDYMIELLES